MAKEADFYSPEEVAKVLGIPERRVFGMLCSGELEGHQDEWARWCVPASALNAPRDPKPSSEPEGSAGNDATATTVRSDRAPLWEPSVEVSSDEETTQEAVEAPVGGTASHTDDGETTQRLPRGNHREAVPDAASNETVRDLAERLAVAEAEARELRTRLELAAAAETTLRESLERERRRADRESARAERERRAAERLQEELRAERNEGFWQRLFGG